MAVITYYCIVMTNFQLHYTLNNGKETCVHIPTQGKLPVERPFKQELLGSLREGGAGLVGL